MNSISVVIPAFNAARYLGEAIASVGAQTLPVSEMIVVDNGSTDGTPALAKQLGVRCEHEPQRGAAAARNRGLAAARGNFFALLDAERVPDSLVITLDSVKSKLISLPRSQELGKPPMRGNKETKCYDEDFARLRLP